MLDGAPSRRGVRQFDQPGVLELAYVIGHVRQRVRHPRCELAGRQRLLLGGQALQHGDTQGMYGGPGHMLQSIGTCSVILRPYPCRCEVH